MAQQTTYKRSFAGSVGSGMQSIMGGGGRRFYVLEHKVSSRYHKAGESQRIIVDQIELGRGSGCQVRFDESFPTVSRRHAAIVKEGDNWKLVQLSQTNSTYLNGHRVQKEWYLQSGDEIQLSTNGPKLGFIIPQGNAGLVKSIGMTARLNLFRQQALRPYKQALTALACLLVIVIGIGTFKIANMDNELKRKGQEIAGLIDANRENTSRADSLAAELVANNQKLGDYEQTISDLIQKVIQGEQTISQLREEITEIGSGEAISNDLSDQCYPHTYAIVQLRMELKMNGETLEALDYTHDSNGNPQTAVVGTGFMLSDGRFITARHVTETYYYYEANWSSDPEQNAQIKSQLAFQNAIANNGGEVISYFKAISNSGRSLTFNTTQCTCDRSHDATSTRTLDNGTPVVLKSANVSTTDWTCFRSSGSEGLPFDDQLSGSLPAGTRLQILGFPLGRGAEDIAHPSPISSHAEVARQGLDVDGTIMASNDDTQSGNSGGPVFVKENGKYTVVGILSGSTAGKGRIVPIRVVP